MGNITLRTSAAEDAEIAVVQGGVGAWMAKEVSSEQSIPSRHKRCRINTTPKNVTTSPRLNTPSP